MYYITPLYQIVLFDLTFRIEAWITIIPRTMGQSPSSRSVQAEESASPVSLPLADSASSGGAIIKSSQQILQQITELFNPEDQHHSVLCVQVVDWKTYTPSVSTILDADSSWQSDDVLVDMLHPRGYLEFRVKLPPGYPEGRVGFHSITQGLLRGVSPLGIKTVHFDKRATKYLRSLKKSKRKQPKWSNTISAFGVQVSWTHDYSHPHLIIFQLRVDKETIVVVVDETDGIHKTKLNNDIVSLSSLIRLWIC
jgi:hypothetical protein